MWIEISFSRIKLLRSLPEVGMEVLTRVDCRIPQPSQTPYGMVAHIIKCFAQPLQICKSIVAIKIKLLVVSGRLLANTCCLPSIREKAPPPPYCATVPDTYSHTYPVNVDSPGLVMDDEWVQGLFHSNGLVLISYCRWSMRTFMG